MYLGYLRDLRTKAAAKQFKPPFDPSWWKELELSQKHQNIVELYGYCE